MEPMDEQLLKAKKQMEDIEKERHAKETVEEENKQSIYDENMTIYKIPVKFKPFTLVEDQISLYMPDDFVMQDEALIKQIYPLGNRPQYVYANDYLYFSIGFNYTQNKIPNEQIRSFTDLAATVLERVGPKSKIYDIRQHQVGTDYVGSIELVTQALQQAMYNLMFFSSVEGRVLIGFINFPVKYMDRLKPVAKEIVASFKIIHKEEEA